MRESEFARFQTLYLENHRLLRDAIQTGFSGLNARLDEMNGRVRTTAEQTIANTGDIRNVTHDLETVVADCQSKITQIQERGCAVGMTLHRSVTGELVAGLPEEEALRPRVTKRDLVIGGGAAGAGIVIIKLGELASDWVHHLMQWK